MILELLVTSDVLHWRLDRLLRGGSFYCKYLRCGRYPQPFEQVCFQGTEDGSQEFSVSQAVG